MGPSPPRRSSTAADPAGAAPAPAAEAAATAPASRREFLTLGGLAALGLAGFSQAGCRRKRAPDPVFPPDLGASKAAARKPLPADAPTIRVGVLHSLTGTLAVSEHPLADASLLAIEEINARGGLLGKRVQPVVMDGKSEITADSAFTRGAERLLDTEKVAVVFGGFGSAGRKMIKPYFEKFDRLLFYPSQYEGLEESQNLVYMGATPNQLAIPALKWATDELRAKRYFLVGTDGLRAHAINAIIEDNLKSLGGEVLGEQYALLGESDFSGIVDKIEKNRPDMIISTLVGDSILSFFKALTDADLTSRILPVMSFMLGENELAQISDPVMAGHYVASTRFQKLPNPSGDSFEKRFKKKYGEQRPVSDTMESSYYGVLLWAAAVERAGSEDVSKVRLAIKEKEFELGDMRVRIDASNLHAWKVFQVGKVTNDSRIEVIKTGDTLIPPSPFPGPRTRAEWQDFSEALYKKWKKNWANPQKPKGKKGGKKKKDR